MALTTRIIKINIITIVLPVIIIALSFISTAHAIPPWEQTHQLLAVDGNAGDWFGTSVAMSGNMVVIGAIHDKNYKRDTGSAYVFDVTTGQQLFKLLASDGAGFDYFGISVAVDGNLAVIGASGKGENTTSSSSAYVFDITTGQQLIKLRASDGEAFDYFGGSVSISGNLAVIGAFADDDNGIDSGSAYVFDVTTGQQLFKLLPDDGSAGSRFGFSVAASGKMAVIGAYLDDGIGTTSGSAYVFDITTGQQLFKLLPDDGGVGSRFGFSVAMNGTTVVIGAYLDEDNGTASGSAYVFDINTGQQLFKLLATDARAGDVLGYSVAVNGNNAVVGAIADNDNLGESSSVYVFDITTGQQLFKLLPSPSDAYNYFGYSVAVSGNTTVIGAVAADNNNGKISGSAYVFEPRTKNLLAISPYPLLGGSVGIFSIIKTLPEEQTWLLYSLNGLGSKYLRKLNVVIDLANPKIAVGPRTTNTNGDLQLNLSMPAVQSTIEVWFQAVQRNNLTNFVTTQVIP